ncbi:MAG TPA: thioredoxin domain-containing protein [Amycolatopsis sp.]|nr:thioredoxin domain-containing protein [Amycolatopsis sp.]
MNTRKNDRGGRKARSAVASARRPNRSMTIGVVVVVVLAAAVIGGVLYQRHRTAEAAVAVIPAVHAAATYPTTVDRAGATVLVGKDTAKVTVDAYEDFLCPICGQFEAANFPDLEKQLSAGTVQVRYHLLNLLDDRSVPPGYSMMAANTALAVATVAPEKFLDFHYSLYQKQPEESGPGWTQAQLTSLANRLGVSGAPFDNLVDGKTYDARIQQNLQTAENDQSLWQTSSQGSGFGTPTIVIGGKPVDWTQPGWLDNAVSAAYPS